MAIEIEIPKDITKYEAKLIGPFTTRQTICLIPAVGIGIAVFKGLAPFVSQDIRTFIVMLVAVPLLLCGWYKPYGLPFEKFIQSVFVSLILEPKHRKYVTENVYEVITKQETQPANKKTKGKKDNQKAKTDHSFIAYD